MVSCSICAPVRKKFSRTDWFAANVVCREHL
jgi:hypothetical protein